MVSSAMVHIELFDKKHFSQAYVTKKPSAPQKLVATYRESGFTGLPRIAFTENLLPDIGFTLMINLGSPYRLVLHDQLHYVTGDIAYPSVYAPRRIHSPGNKIFEIHFFTNPRWLTSAWKDDAELIQDAANLLLGNARTSEIKNAACFRERVRIAERELKDKFNRYRFKRELASVAHLLHKMKTAAGATSFAELLDAQSLTRPLLERRFRKYTGAGLDMNWRILRFRKSLKEYLVHTELDCIEQKFYFDNGHFLDDMKEFTGHLPDDKLNILHRRFEFPYGA